MVQPSPAIPAKPGAAQVDRSLAGLLPTDFRKRLLIFFLLITLIASVTAAVLVWSQAESESRANQDRVAETAVTLSLTFDQEVTAFNFLLKGLSTSPALQNGDLRTFYDQLQSTPRPDGSWLILQGLDRQLLNTLRPYGDPTLPMHSAFANYEEQIARIRDLGWTVSGRIYGLVRAAVTVVLSLRVNGPDGQMKYFLTTAIGESRLNEILDTQRLPNGWTSGLYDRRLQPIVTSRRGIGAAAVPIPHELAERLANVPMKTTMSGVVRSTDERGEPIFVAYRRSGPTDWTTLVSVPVDELDAPVRDALWQVAVPALVLLLLAGIAALVAARQVEAPFRSLSQEFHLANSKVDELSSQLLVLQEEERQTIARELHDSTAQHLVAANLAMMKLEKFLDPSPKAEESRSEVESLLDRALTELRVFTYLLHPPNLAREGLRATVHDFAEGFARRTNIATGVAVPQAVDATDPDLQRMVLRIVQEALTNIHRHARATHAQIRVRIAGGRLFARISDNGRGPASFDVGRDGRVRLGVGIPGMQARLQQFGGHLAVKSRPGGTTIFAVVPLVPKAVAVLRQPLVSLQR